MKRPDYLFHYTNQSGLIGIAEGRRIWASKIQYMNDSREFNHALQLAQAIIDLRLRGALSRSARSFLRDLRSRLSDVATQNVFVCSFSGDGDQLRQWRGYCTPGDGFALGLPVASLQALATLRGWYLLQCLYDIDQQRGILTSAIDYELGRLGTDPGAPRIDLEPFIDHCLGQVMPWAPAMKDPSFAEEREWRLVSPPLDIAACKVRAGRFALIPYVEFDLVGPRTAFGPAEIVVGPSPYPILSEGVRALMKTLGITANVTTSVVSYRDW